MFKSGNDDTERIISLEIYFLSGRTMTKRLPSLDTWQQNDDKYVLYILIFKSLPELA